MPSGMRLGLSIRSNPVMGLPSRLNLCLATSGIISLGEIDSDARNATSIRVKRKMTITLQVVNTQIVKFELRDGVQER
jgi:hypothetical protein